MDVRRWLVAGLAFGVLWVFVSGAELTLQSLLGNLLVGLAIGFPVAFVFRRLYGEELDVFRSVTVIPYVLRYLLAFGKEIVVANIDVTYRIFAPSMPLEPQVILVPLRVETDLGIATIANSISVTPGTVTLDYDPDENALYVHVINGQDPEAVVEPIHRWENDALRIFSEPASPDETPRDVTVHPPDYPPEPKPALDSAYTVTRTIAYDEGGGDDDE